jgi:light-regulated signal transduction histidine kinase (bacteriophytochrome)
MNVNTKNIERTLTSSASIDTKIASLFSDFAILDVEFNIVSVSQNILNATGYTTEEVLYKPLSLLSGKSNFITQLEDLLRPGYFEEHRVELFCKGGNAHSYSISGFYMGMTHDSNRLIILKFNPIDESKQTIQVHNLGAEVDEFIYTTSHLLRGPLATLKGLIHLARDPRSKKDMGYLLEQMTVFADRLDEKLHQLIYVAESDKSQKSVPESLFIDAIFDSLAISIRESSIDFPVNFHSHVADHHQVVEKGELVLPMLNNLVLFFCQQSKTEHNLLVFDALSSSSAIEIIIRSRGFLFNESLIERMEKVNFGYSQILNFPELINFYAAKKIMTKLNGSIQFMLIAGDEMVVLMTVPRDAPATQG